MTEKNNEVWIEDTTNNGNSKSESTSSVKGDSPVNLSLKDKSEVVASAKSMVEETGMAEYEDLITRGALLAYFPSTYDQYAEYSDREKKVIQDEKDHRWRQTPTMYLVAATVAVAAACQGMDESTIGGAQLIYPEKFNIDTTTTKGANIEGMVNSIPYLSAAVIGCWAAIPSNYYFGRRVTIFWSLFLGMSTGFWQGFASSWELILAGRLFMGIAIGAASATAPVMTAECAPPTTRGAMVMLWQTFTAFGVMMGYVVSVAFLKVKHNWRLMLGSIFVPALIVCIAVFFLPDSPRWYITKSKYRKAFQSFNRLRRDPIIAARDFYYTYELIRIEQAARSSTTWYQRISDLVTVRRNRAALVASWICMVSQQGSGVNVLTFYLGKITADAGFTDTVSLAGCVGFGACSVLGAITAIKIIDIKGRRWLLLTTFPIMVAFLLWIAFAFYAEESNLRLGLLLGGIYVYVYFYGIGAGPVPFTYTAEAFPVYCRAEGAAFGTATTWFFCWVLGFTLPNMLLTFKNVGVFCFYAALCAIFFVLILFFVPETKQYTLEELDMVFDIPISAHASYQWNEFMRMVFRRAKPPKQPGEPEDDLIALSMKHNSKYTAELEIGEKKVVA